MARSQRSSRGHDPAAHLPAVPPPLVGARHLQPRLAAHGRRRRPAGLRAHGLVARGRSARPLRARAARGARALRRCARRRVRPPQGRARGLDGAVGGDRAHRRPGVAAPELGRVLYALVAAQSAAFAINNPARSAIIPRLVEPRLLPAANALQTIAWNVALTVGPLGGAFLVALWGYQVAYTIDAVLFTAALWAVWRLPDIPPLPAAPAPRPRSSHPRGAGAASWGGGPSSTACGTSRPSPTSARRSSSTSPRWCSPRRACSCPPPGSCSSGAARRRRASSPRRSPSGPCSRACSPAACRACGGRAASSCGAITAYGLSIVLFGVVLLGVGATTPTTVLVGGVAAASVALALAGASDAVSAVFRQTILQTATPDDMRGRLQGVFIVVVAGGPRLGELVLGAQATWVGRRGPPSRGRGVRRRAVARRGPSAASGVTTPSTRSPERPVVAWAARPRLGACLRRSRRPTRLRSTRSPWTTCGPATPTTSEAEADLEGFEITDLRLDRLDLHGASVFSSRLDQVRADEADLGAVTLTEVVLGRLDVPVVRGTRAGGARSRCGARASGPPSSTSRRGRGAVRGLQAQGSSTSGARRCAT